MLILFTSNCQSLKQELSRSRCSINVYKGREERKEVGERKNGEKKRGREEAGQGKRKQDYWDKKKNYF